MAPVKMNKPPGGGGAGWKPPRAGTREKSVVPIGVRVSGRRLTPGCTLNVSEGGALLICSEDVPVGTEMEVTNLRSHEIFTCRVVWRAGAHESSRFSLGVEIRNAGRETAGASDAAEHDETKN
jgi:hypothetical protein